MSGGSPSSASEGSPGAADATVAAAVDSPASAAAARGAGDGPASTAGPEPSAPSTGVILLRRAAASVVPSPSGSRPDPSPSMPPGTTPPTTAGVALAAGTLGVAAEKLGLELAKPRQGVGVVLDIGMAPVRALPQGAQLVERRFGRR